LTSFHLRIFPMFGSFFVFVRIPFWLNPKLPLGELGPRTSTTCRTRWLRCRWRSAGARARCCCVGESPGRTTGRSSAAAERILAGEFRVNLPSGYVKIAIEHDHRNSGFSHEKWWFSIAMLIYQRVLIYLHHPCWNKPCKMGGPETLITKKNRIYSNLTWFFSLKLWHICFF